MSWTIRSFAVMWFRNLSGLAKSFLAYLGRFRDCVYWRDIWSSFLCELSSWVSKVLAFMGSVWWELLWGCIVFPNSRRAVLSVGLLASFIRQDDRRFGLG